MVICAYSDRRRDALNDAVAAALTQDPAPHEVILVIDHNDGLLSDAQSRLKHVNVIPNGHERGLSGARNTGVQHASGDVVVFLDDDARPLPGWLSGLLDALNDPAVIGAGGVARPIWETQAPSWFPSEFLWVVGCSYVGLPDSRTEIRNPIGATMAFRRIAFEKAGGFTDGIGRVGRTPLGCEETEFSIRAARATGGVVVHVPRAVVDHLVPADRGRWDYFWRRCWAEGLSKAIVARHVGQDSALSSEQSYVLRTLPLGFLRGLVQGVRGDLGGFARAGAIVMGLVITTLGYVRGRLARRTSG